jgi:hypothetical protein
MEEKMSQPRIAEKPIGTGLQLKGLKLHDAATFGQHLLDHLVLQGFQALGKRDIELLVVYLLEQDGALAKTMTNFEVASHLRLSPSKVKGLRKDAYARWRPLTPKERNEALVGIMRELFTSERIESAMKHVSEPDKKSGFIAVRIEHPADLMLMDQAVIEANGIPKYERNQDVLLIRFDVLLEMAGRMGILEKDDRAIVKAIEAEFRGKAKLEEILGKDLSTLKGADLRQALNDLAIKALITPSLGIPIFGLLKVAITAL